MQLLDISQIQLLRGLLYAEINNLEEQVSSVNIFVSEEWMDHLQRTMSALDKLEDELCN